MCDFENVKGFKELDPKRQELLKNTYQRHFDCMSGWMKEKWAPQTVEAADYGVKVIMPGTWFHYNWKGEWY
ncbi:MAG: hypothetical protein K0R54_2268 [Clostridiaceae bacterium]|jgi:hypothetical protein|nr:hypothetical protein [Clostridiaceae bacterium]